MPLRNPRPRLRGRGQGEGLLSVWLCNVPCLQLWASMSSGPTTRSCFLKTKGGPANSCPTCSHRSSCNCTTTRSRAIRMPLRNPLPRLRGRGQGEGLLHSFNRRVPCSASEMHQLFTLSAFARNLRTSIHPPAKPRSYQEDQPRQSRLPPAFQALPPIFVLFVPFVVPPHLLRCSLPSISCHVHAPPKPSPTSSWERAG